MGKLDRPSFLEVEKALWESFVLLAGWDDFRISYMLKFGQ